MLGRMVIVALALSSPMGMARTVDDVVARHLRARGGVARLKAVKSVRMTGAVSVGGSATGRVTYEAKRPRRVRLDITVQGQQTVLAYDGARAWQIDPSSGKTAAVPLSGQDARDLENEADLDGALVDYRAKGHRLELLGQHELVGRATYKLRLTYSNGVVELWYLDAERFLPLRTEGEKTAEEPEPTFEEWTDYRSVRGVMFAHVIGVGPVGQPARMKITFDEVEIDAPVDDARFKMPPAPAR